MCQIFFIKVPTVLHFMQRDKPSRKNITERTNEIKGHAITDVTEPHRTSHGMRIPMADKAYITRSQNFGALNTLRTSFSFVVEHWKYNRELKLIIRSYTFV